MNLKQVWKNIIVKLKNNKEFIVYFNRENHPEIIKFGIRAINKSENCRLEIETIYNKCKDLKLLEKPYKDDTEWKYDIVKELSFCDSECTIENISQIFKSMVYAIDNS